MIKTLCLSANSRSECFCEIYFLCLADTGLACAAPAISLHNAIGREALFETAVAAIIKIPHQGTLGDGIMVVPFYPVLTLSTEYLSPPGIISNSFLPTLLSLGGYEK